MLHFSHLQLYEKTPLCNPRRHPLSVTKQIITIEITVKNKKGLGKRARNAFLKDVQTKDVQGKHKFQLTTEKSGFVKYTSLL